MRLRLAETQRRVLTALRELQEHVALREQLLLASALDEAVPGDVGHSRGQFRELFLERANAGHVKLDLRRFCKRGDGSQQCLAALFALEPGEEQNPQRVGRRPLGLRHGPDIDAVADDLDPRFRPPGLAMQFRGRQRRRNQHPDVLLEAAVVARVDGAETAQALAHSSVAALHRSARAEQMQVVQRVRDRGRVFASYLPHRRRESVDVVRVDHIRLDLVQHPAQRENDRRIPQVDGVPAGARQAARQIALFVVTPVQIPGRHSPHSYPLAYLALVRLAAKLGPPASRNDVHLVSQPVERPGQLSGQVFGSANRIGRKQ